MSGYRAVIELSVTRRPVCKVVKQSATVATSVKAGNRKSGGIIHCFFLVKSCQLEVRGFDIKTEF